MPIARGFPRLKRPEPRRVAAVTTASPSPSPAIQAEEAEYDEEGRRILSAPLPAPMRREATILYQEPASEHPRNGFPRAKPSAPPNAPAAATVTTGGITAGRGPRPLAPSRPGSPAGSKGGGMPGPTPRPEPVVKRYVAQQIITPDDIPWD